MEQGDVGNRVGDVGSADVQLIRKNRLSLPDSCLTTDQTELHLRSTCQTHLVSNVAVQMSLPHRSLFKVKYAQNELKVTNPELMNPEHSHSLKLKNKQPIQKTNQEELQQL